MNRSRPTTRRSPARLVAPALALGLLAACPTAEPAPGTAFLGPWDAGDVDEIVLSAAAGQVVISGSAGVGQLTLTASSDIFSTSLEAGVLTISASGDVQLSTPAELDWTIETQSGDVSVSGLGGTGTVVTDTGEVICTGLLGNLSVQVQDNSPVAIHLEALPSGGVVIIESTLGPIVLDVPADTSATLAATTGSGSVDVTGVDFDGVLLDQSAEGVLGDGDGSLRLVTGGGDVAVSGYGD